MVTQPLQLTPKVRAGDYLLTGDMTLMTVKAALREASGLIASAYTPLTFDFSGVRACDSSGIALLIEWQKQAIRAHCHLTFEHLPMALKSIMQVTGTLDLLPVSED